MSKVWLLILLISHIHDASCVINDIYHIGQEMWKLYSITDKISLNDDDFGREGSELFSDSNIRKQMTEIFNQLTQVETFMNPKIISDSLKLLPLEVILDSSLSSIERSVQAIDISYNNFYRYMNQTNYHSSDRMGGSLQSLIANVEGEITWMRKLVAEANDFLPNHKNVVNAVSSYAVRSSARLCGGLRLISNVLVQLFRMVTIADIKANHMLAVANIYQYSANNEWKSLNLFIKDRFEEHFATYVEIFALNINTTKSLYLRACDPADSLWIRNQDFYELERTVQTTIFRYHWGACKYGSCNDILFKQPNRCEPEAYDSRSSCFDTPAQCTYLNAIEACVLRNGPYKFQYVNSSELGVLGSNFKCPKDNGYLIKDGKGWDAVYSACACNCYASRNKISLAIMQSRVTSSMVITGVRFIRKNEILYIQPREGRLESRGYIPQHSQRWIPIPNNLDTSLIQPIDRENRVFFLDDVRLPSSYVLTGVKFNKVTRGNVTGFAIEIFGAPFDFKTGIIHSAVKFRISWKASNYIIGRSLVFDRVRPINESIPHTPSPAHFNYVSLERSELSADFGQSTLPFIDAVPVRTQPPSVLGGIGIFHKGVAGYAGFISIRVFGIAYRKFFLDFQLQYIAHGKVLFNGSKYD